MRPIPRVIAHRGASVEAPENTLAAFRRALAIGCRAIEFDVQLTSDGRPVVVHDDTLERTTSGEGAVAEASFAEVRALDAGAWFGPEFRGERVPALEEVFALARERPDVLLNVEIKTDRHDYAGIEAAVGDAAREAGVLPRLVVTSFNPATVERFHVRHPEVPTGVILLGEPTPGEVERYARFAKALGLYAGCVTAEAMRAAREAKLAVVAWTVNEPDVADHLLAMGVEAVITDDPRALAALL